MQSDRKIIFSVPLRSDYHGFTRVQNIIGKYWQIKIILKILPFQIKNPTKYRNAKIVVIVCITNSFSLSFFGKQNYAAEKQYKGIINRDKNKRFSPSQWYWPHLQSQRSLLPAIPFGKAPDGNKITTRLPRTLDSRY
ncbi:MAG: hypothetical protein PHH77_12290 [Victivallaceae bacterium]|nr:hypothetical protein [Victivallaceae bacterium]